MSRCQHTATSWAALIESVTSARAATAMRGGATLVRDGITHVPPPGLSPRDGMITLPAPITRVRTTTTKDTPWNAN